MKRVLRIAVMAPGVLYLWALLPVSFRPQYTGSPFRKSDPTITVQLGAFGNPGVAAVVKAAAAATLQAPSSSRLKAACEPPGLLRPIVRPSQHVVVRYVDNGRVVAEKSYDCKAR